MTKVDDEKKQEEIERAWLGPKYELDMKDGTKALCRFSVDARELVQDGWAYVPDPNSDTGRRLFATLDEKTRTSGVRKPAPAATNDDAA